MVDDIFERFNERMKKFFGEFSGFEDDFDDFFKDFEHNIKMKSPKGEKFTKNYSISYNYHTGMDKPEIFVKGDASEQDIDKFLKGVQSSFGKNFLDIADNTIKFIGPSASGDKQIRELNHEREFGFRSPMSEIIDEKENTTVVLEMPGISPGDIKITNSGDIYEITAEREDIKYRKRIQIPFEVKDKKISGKNGIITLEFTK